MGSKIKFPAVDVPILSANSPIENSDQKVLFVGSVLPNASSPSVVQNVPNSAKEINDQFGAGSIMAQMLISARSYNKDVQFDALIVPDGGGAAATATLAFTGTAAEGDSVKIFLGSKARGLITVSLDSGDNATAIGSKVSTAINNFATNEFGDNDLGISATDATGTVTLTSANAGLIGNSISLQAEAVSETDAFSITFSGFQTTGTGTLGPDLTGALDLIGEERYQTVVWPYSEVSDLQVITDFLDDRFNATGETLDGVAINYQIDTFANLNTFVNDNSINSQSLVLFGQELQTDTTSDVKYESTDIFEFPWGQISQFGSVRALRRQPNTSIAEFVTTRSGALDAIGGPALSSKPYANTPFKDLPVIPVDRGFDKEEIDDLNDNGVSVLGNNKSRTDVISGQVVTTYRFDSAGDPDITFKFLNFVDTASTGREYFFNNLGSTFAQSRLTLGDLVRGRDMANEASIKAIMVKFYNDLTGEDFVAMQSGESALNFFKNNLKVTANLETGNADVEFVAPIVTQLRSINAPMTLSFNLE